MRGDDIADAVERAVALLEASAWAVQQVQWGRWPVPKKDSRKLSFADGIKKITGQARADRAREYYHAWLTKKRAAANGQTPKEAADSATGLINRMQAAGFSGPQVEKEKLEFDRWWTSQKKK